MRTLEDLDRLVVSSEHARGRRAQLEIRGRKRLGLVRAGERLVRLEPRALGVRGAGAPEVGLARAHSNVILRQVPPQRERLEDDRTWIEDVAARSPATATWRRSARSPTFPTAVAGLAPS